MNRFESIAAILCRHDWSVKIVVNSTRQYVPLLVSDQVGANAWFGLHLQGRWLYGLGMKSLFFAISLAIGLAACGGKDEPKTPDAPVVVIDAPKAVDAPPATANALGQRCGQTAGMCPAGNTCALVMGLGNQMEGYCSPSCMAMDTKCSVGYTGPAGGMAVCALGPAAGQGVLCAIICTVDTQCPTGLKCLDAGGGKICVVPV